jgi:hypothetical protein
MHYMQRFLSPAAIRAIIFVTEQFLENAVGYIWNKRVIDRAELGRCHLRAKLPAPANGSIRNARTILYRALRNQHITAYGEDSRRRCFAYLDDVLAPILLLAKQKSS